MKKSIKIFIITSLFSILGLISLSIFATSSITTDVYVHYYRFDNAYEAWDLWLWQSMPTSKEGSAFSFETDTTDAAYNFGGVVAKIELSGSLEDATELGFIIRKPDWSSKDIDNDRFMTINETSEEGIQHVYLVQGDTLIGYSLGDPSGPLKSPKFTQSYFTKTDEIMFKSTEALTESQLSIKKDGVTIVPESIDINEKTGQIKLNESVDFGATYELSAVFADSSINKIVVTFEGIYDSPEFEEAFHYTGNDLGAHVNNGKTTFRLWAPVSSAVSINLYHSGTTIRDGGETDTPYSVIPMIKSVNGTYFYEINESLHNIYYTYSVTNGNATHEVVDPYTYSTGVNGRRGLVIDFSEINPTGFSYNSRPNNIVNKTDAIIYELHVRDLSTHSSWNGSDENRGKFLGLIEKGTSYLGHKTGFDHILDLGVTHVQLLPFFDYGVVDETKLNDETYNQFNWGYMPLHFNTPEGSYSSDPYDGLSRVIELKQVTTKFTENNIRLNMDVVYNHTGLTADSNFNLIVPGYYHRKTDTGTFSNGSGTGNETASERIMMRKFMIDSLVFWAKEYNISGFRFDLMALHDVTTMLEINNALNEMDSSIMVYGEPWMGGTSTLPSILQSGKKNLDQLDTIGAFNDDFRDSVKGSVFNREFPGFINGNFGNDIINRVKYGIVGGTAHPDLIISGLSEGKVWHSSPEKTINYVTAHDNNTLYDKLYQTNVITGNLEYIDEMAMQAYSILMTSQGVVFIHAGDEILRSKPNSNGIGFDHNSYQSPDSVNQIRWDQKALEDNIKVYNHIKGLIALRKSDDAYRQTTMEAISQSIEFGYKAIDGLLSYIIDTDKDIIVIHNANEKSVKLELPLGSAWDVLVNGETSGTSTIKTYMGGEGIKIQAHESLVLYENKEGENISSFKQLTNQILGYTTIDAENPQPSTLWLVITTSFILLAIASGTTLYVIKKKKTMKI